MPQRLALAAERGCAEDATPVEAVIVGQANKQVDLVMLSVGGVEQAIGVFQIGCGQMPDDLQCAEVGTVGFDAADGGNRVERMRGASPLVDHGLQGRENSPT